MNILKKIEDGGIPTERELEIVRSAGAPLPAAKAPAPEAAEFQLDMTVPEDRKGQAAFYEAGEKTIKTWAKIGRDHNDLAPLTNPPAMVQWWERLKEKGVLKHRVPENLLNAAAKWEKRIADATASVDPAEAAEAVIEPMDLAEFETDEMDFEVGAKMARLNYRIHAKLLRDAHASNNHDQRRQAHAAYEKAFEMWVAAESRKTKIMAEQGLSVSREEVRHQLVQLHAPIPKRLKASLRVAWRYLPEPRLPQALWNEAVEKSVNEACEDLVTNCFTELRIA